MTGQQQQQTEVQNSPQEQNIMEDTIAGIPTILIDKVFVESRSRGNFAKNLTFKFKKFSHEKKDVEEIVQGVYLEKHNTRSNLTK